MQLPMQACLHFGPEAGDEPCSKQMAQERRKKIIAQSHRPLVKEIGQEGQGPVRP